MIQLPPQASFFPFIYIYFSTLYFIWKNFKVFSQVLPSYTKLAYFMLRLEKLSDAFTIISSIVSSISASKITS